MEYGNSIDKDIHVSGFDPGEIKELGNKIDQDWDEFLHSLHLQKMVLNPGMFLDAKVNHATGNCPCKCTGNLHFKEVRKHKMSDRKPRNYFISMN